MQNSRIARGFDRKRGPTVQLRAKWETDNFCYSHCCTSDVHFGQGRAGASNTSASRYFKSSCYRVSPCGAVSFCTARPCIASALQRPHRSNTEFVNPQFPA